MSHAALALAVMLAAVAIGLAGPGRRFDRTLVLAVALGAVAVVTHVAELLLA